MLTWWCWNLNDSNSTAPIEEGKKYEVDITDIGQKGDGIARIDGFVVFVPETNIGDRVTVEIDRVLNNFGVAEVVEESYT